MKGLRVLSSLTFIKIIGSTALSVLVTFALDALKAKPFASTIKIAVIAFSEFIAGILDFEIKLWWIIDILVFVKTICYIISRIVEPGYLDYTSDEFDGWKWEWSWKKDASGKYRLGYLIPVCKKCDTPLITSGTTLTTSYVCPRCKLDAGSDLPDPTTIVTLIDGNIKERRKAKRTPDVG